MPASQPSLLISTGPSCSGRRGKESPNKLLVSAIPRHRVEGGGRKNLIPSGAKHILFSTFLGCFVVLLCPYCLQMGPCCLRHLLLLCLWEASPHHLSSSWQSRFPAIVPSRRKRWYTHIVPRVRKLLAQEEARRGRKGRKSRRNFLSVFNNTLMHFINPNILIAISNQRLINARAQKVMKNFRAVKAKAEGGRIWRPRNWEGLRCGEGENHWPF